MNSWSRVRGVAAVNPAILPASSRSNKMRAYSSERKSSGPAGVHGARPPGSRASSSAQNRTPAWSEATGQLSPGDRVYSCAAACTTAARSTSQSSVAVTAGRTGRARLDAWVEARGGSDGRRAPGSCETARSREDEQYEAIQRLASIEDSVFTPPPERYGRSSGVRTGVQLGRRTSSGPSVSDPIDTGGLAVGRGASGASGRSHPASAEHTREAAKARQERKTMLVPIVCTRCQDTWRGTPIPVGRSGISSGQGFPSPPSPLGRASCVTVRC